MTPRISRRVAGGALAVALTASVGLLGAGAANATAPANPDLGDGSFVGQEGFYIGADDPNIYVYTWNGSSWDFSRIAGEVTLPR